MIRIGAVHILRQPISGVFRPPLPPFRSFSEKYQFFFIDASPNRTKHKDFLMGPSVKFVLAIIDSFFFGPLPLDMRLQTIFVVSGVV